MRLHGVLDDVTTGLRATFRTGPELVAALMAAMGTDRTVPPESAGGRPILEEN